MPEVQSHIMVLSTGAVNEHSAWTGLVTPKGECLLSGSHIPEYGLDCSRRYVKTQMQTTNTRSARIASDGYVSAATIKNEKQKANQVSSNLILSTKQENEDPQVVSILA